MQNKNVSQQKKNPQSDLIHSLARDSYIQQREKWALCYL